MVTMTAMTAFAETTFADHDRQFAVADPADRFVLGVDLDGVCGDYTNALRTFCRSRGIDVPDGDPLAWDLVDAGWFPDRDAYAYAHNSAIAAGIFAWMPELDGASDALWTLSDAEVHIRVVTHRLSRGMAGMAASDTVRWLDQARADGRPRIPYRDLCFLGTKQALDSDLHIDDAPHVIAAMHRSGHDVIVMDASYNRDFAGFEDAEELRALPRARDWAEALGLILARVEASGK